MTRRQAREIALQSLFRMEMNQTSPDEAVAEVFAQMAADQEKEIEKPNAKTMDFITWLVKGTWQLREELDERFSQHLQHWKLDRLPRVDRQVLRLAVYEMFYAEDTPWKAVINEAIELAKRYGTEESGRFINGVLGQMIKQQTADTSKGD